MIWAEKWTG